MNVLIVSDSHGNIDALLEAEQRVRPDLLLHLGDHFHDMEALQAQMPQLRCIGVRGNCDAPGPEEQRILQLEGRTLLLTHGHRYSVKSGLDRLWFAAREANADFCLFGHTHVPTQEQEGGITFLNPGSIGRGWPPTYALLTLDKDYQRVEILNL